MTGPMPGLGPKDFRVHPEALWEVGVALQATRDSLWNTAQSVSALNDAVPQQVSSELAEPEAAWTQQRAAVRDDLIGLQQQLEKIVASVDVQMNGLRQVIDAYRAVDRHNERRVTNAGGR